MHVVHLGGEEFLKDPEDRLKLIGLEDVAGAAGNEGAEEAGEGRDGTTVFPDGRVQDRRNEGGEVGGQRDGLVGLEKGCKELQNVRVEFRDRLSKYVTKCFG